MIVVGIDPCFSCNDRSITLRRHGSASPQTMTWDELRDYGIRYYAGGGT